MNGYGNNTNELKTKKTMINNVSAVPQKNEKNSFKLSTPKNKSTTYFIIYLLLTTDSTHYFHLFFGALKS